MPFEFTGKCRICLSKNGQTITAMMVAGVPYKQIIAAFPDELNDPSMLSVHKRHFVAPESYDESEIPKTDTEFIDRLRYLGGIYVVGAINGAPLTQSETRVIGEAVKAILGRKQLEDRQEQSEAFNRLLSGAVKARWKPDGE